MKNSPFRAAFACLSVGLMFGSLAFGCAVPVLEDTDIDDPRVRQLLPGMDKTVGYFELANNTDKTIRLIGAEAIGIGAIEIHETTQVEGLVRMQRLASVEITPESRLAFAPGGKHLMLFRVEPLGSSLKVRLIFENLPAQEVDFRVFGIGEG